jgi:hypothetical protein
MTPATSTAAVDANGPRCRDAQRREADCATAADGS